MLTVSNHASVGKCSIFRFDFGRSRICPAILGEGGCVQPSPAHTTAVPPGHADAEARRSVLTALPCATLVTVPTCPAILGEGDASSPAQPTRQNLRHFASAGKCFSATEQISHPERSVYFQGHVTTSMRLLDPKAVAPTSKHRNVKHEIRTPKHQRRNAKAESRNQNHDSRDLELETPSTQPETPNPKPWV